jgi:hypothetical protein
MSPKAKIVVEYLNKFNKVFDLEISKCQIDFNKGFREEIIFNSDKQKYLGMFRKSVFLGFFLHIHKIKDDKLINELIDIIYIENIDYLKNINTEYIYDNLPLPLFNKHDIDYPLFNEIATYYNNLALNRDVIYSIIWEIISESFKELIVCENSRVNFYDNPSINKIEVPVAFFMNMFVIPNYSITKMYNKNYFYYTFSDYIDEYCNIYFDLWEMFKSFKEEINKKMNFI